MRWRPSRTKSVSPARVSRTGGGSRPSSSHARYRSILVRSRPRSRRRMSASGTQVDVNDAYAARLLPRGRLVRTGGVEPPQPWATRLQRAELAGARRPQGETRRPIGFEPTQRGSRPRMLAVTSRPPGEMEGGIGSPQPEAEALPFRSAPEPAVTHRRPCQRESAPPPPHRSALEACRSQLHVRARALHQPLFRHFLDPPVGGSILIARVGFEPTVSSS